VRIRGIAYDSRRTHSGDLFVAIQGAQHDGIHFVADAVRNGAVAVCVDRSVPERFVIREAGPCVPVLRVPDPREALARLVHAFYREPSRKLCVIGITGTNGKTTTAKMVQSILEHAGRYPAFFGTVGYQIGERQLPAPTTTPPSADLARMLKECLAEGHDSAVMEVSSHGLDQHRVTGTRFHAVAFTNLTRDHQEYHGDMERYFRAKRRLFEMLDREAPAVIDTADPPGRRLVELLRKQGNPIVITGVHDADVRAENVVPDAAGSRFFLHTPRGGAEVRLEIPGGFNVANAVSAAGVAVALGLPLEAIVQGIERLPPVAGRMERFVIPGVNATVVVDYAHTHVGLAGALGALSDLLRNRRGPRGRLTVVFGCGGGKDPGRRPRMGRVAAEIADRVIVTSDNPRHEDRDAIIQDILRGVPAGRDVEVEPDRAEAIRRAVVEAGSGDLVLVAGKGHEDFQQFRDVTVPFDDRDQVRQAIRDRIGGGQPHQVAIGEPLGG
jgi:UDP-N-acetylmuramoyl-L-alanyl-D-glutamate--2,6-diaminopimelate ligase